MGEAAAGAAAGEVPGGARHLIKGACASADPPGGGAEFVYSAKVWSSLTWHLSTLEREWKLTQRAVTSLREVRERRLFQRVDLLSKDGLRWVHV